MTILYKISEGVADKSFGLNIARMVGFPEEVVKVGATRVRAFSMRSRIFTLQNASEMLETLETGAPMTEEERAARQLFHSCSKMNANEIRYTLMNVQQ